MQGNLKIPLQYKYTNGFNGGLAPVLVGSKYGFINKTGSIVIDPVFDDVGKFISGDLSAAKLSKKWGYINRSGEFIIEPKFKNVSHFTEDRAFVIENEYQVVIKTSGEFIDTKYSLIQAESFNEGLSAVQAEVRK